jgi:hypothetical protein
MDFNFTVWDETFDPDFIKISQQSLIPDKWLNYQAIDHDKYNNSIIKPVNRYVQNLYPKPELVSIADTEIRLRQRNHAEIFLLEKENKLRSLDRPHMRQYYQTKIVYPLREDCFEPTYLFYVPWFIDENVRVRFEQPLEETPIEAYPTVYSYEKVPREARYVEPRFVPFKIKRFGPHMKDENFGKVPLKSAIFDIVLESSDILINRIREFYEQD